MENTGSVRQDFDTGSKPGPLQLEVCFERPGQETKGIMKMETTGA